MDQNKKQNYIDLINKFNVDLPLKEIFVRFIETYNGTNEKEFEELFFSMVGALRKYEELKIKADSFDKMATLNSEFNKELDDLKYVYESLQKGELPLDIPISTDELEDL